jgi:RNA polymerase sigma factor (sigma-70 family)
MIRTQRESVHALWSQYLRTRSVQDRNALIMAYQPLVHRAVWAWQQRLGSQSSLSELASLANDGLLMAVERCRHPDTFRAFAYRRVHGAIVDGLRATNRGLRSRSEECRKAAIQLQVGGRAVSIAMEPLHAPPPVEQCVAVTPPPDSLAAVDDIWDLIRHSLPDPQGQVVFRVFVCGETLTETADSLGIRPDRAGRLLKSALRHLRSKTTVTRALRDIVER